jgi:hypothetical protein
MAKSADVVEAQRRYVEQLVRTANAHLENGLFNYDWARMGEAPGDLQAAIGSLTVATELIAKAFVASRDLSLVVAAPTTAFRALCACPGKLPKDFRISQHLAEALYDSAKTKGFDEILSAVYLFLPSVRRDLEFALKNFRGYRNTALHSAIPERDPFRGLLVAWATIQFFDAIHKTRFSPISAKPTSHELAVQLVDRFNRERLERLAESLQKAKRRAESGELTAIPVEICDPTHEAAGSCPVCSRPALLLGEVDAGFEDDAWDSYSPRTARIVGVFHAQSLLCASCGLELQGVVELEELGVSTDIDVGDELAEWAAMHSPEPVEFGIDALLLDGEDGL